MKSLSEIEDRNFQILSRAMDGLNIVTFMYADEGEIVPGRKTVEPYLVGDRIKTESTQLSAWWLNTPMGTKQGWKTYKLSGIKSISVGKATFDPLLRKGYKSDKDPTMEHVRKFI